MLFRSINGKYTYKHRYSKIIKDTCCVLTGYYIDDDILEPIYDFLKKPSKHVTFADLMRDCLQFWVIACNKDYEACTSMEYFAELCEANGYEFTGYGNVWRYGVAS